MIGIRWAVVNGGSTKNANIVETEAQDAGIMHDEHKINDLFGTIQELSFDFYINMNTVLIRPNLTESRPQLNLGFTLGFRGY